MSKKMPERQKVLIVNLAILATLIWCYFKGYPRTIVLFTGVVLLALANVLMYVKSRQLR